MLNERLLEVVKGIAPLIIVVCVLQFTLVNAPIALFLQFLVGALMAIGGLMFFFIGINGIMQMGEFIGAELPQRGSLLLIIAVAFSIGFVTTVAEPDVLVFSRQVDIVSQGAIAGNAVLYVAAIGVGIFAALAMLRIVFGVRMAYLLTASYSLVIILSFLTPADFAPLAYEAGSVTTGALTSPVVIALALGLSSVLAGRSTIAYGFGLVGLASIGPIIGVMILGIVLT